MITFAETLACLEMGLIYGVVAIGIYLTFRVIDFPDLTCDGSFVCGAAISTIVLKAGWNPWLALVCAAGAGAIAGYMTGILYVYGRVTNLLSGILVAFMLYSLNLKIMGGVPNVTLLSESTLFTQGYEPLFLIAGIALTVWAFCSYVLTTDFGLALRSIGQNRLLAQNYGVNLNHMTIIALMLSNTFFGAGGGLFSQHQGFTDISQGVGTVIIGLAAVMIGDKILPVNSIWLRIFSCLMGSIIYRLIIAFALHSEVLGLNTSDLNLITGLMILGIMRLPSFKRAL